MGAQSVRKISTDDLASVYRMGSGMFSSAEGGLSWKPEAIAEVMCSDPGLSFVCLEKKRIIGFLIAADFQARGEGAQIRWICADRDSKGIKDKLLLAFYREAVLRDISLITALVWSDHTGHADYFKEKGFAVQNTRTVARLVLTDGLRRLTQELNHETETRG